MMLHILQELEKHAGSRGESIAVRAVGSRDPIELTHGKLHEQVVALAKVLDRQIIEGGTILLLGPNKPWYIGAFLAVLAAKKILFPISPDLVAPELAAIAHCSSPAGAITDNAHLHLLSSLFRNSMPLDDELVLLFDPRTPPVNRDGPALLLQSSGTTARPKIVFRDAASLDAVTRNMVNACGFTAADHVLATVPLCHSYGLEHGILAPVTAGCCVHVLEKFDLAVVLDELRRGAITMLPGVPFMFEMLCRSPAQRFPALRLAYSAGGPLPQSVAADFAAKFGLPIGQVYGSTEIGSVTFNNPNDCCFDSSSVGRPMNGVKIMVLAPETRHIDRPLATGMEGVITVKAPSMFRGYLDGSSESMIDGYFLTGDTGFLNSDGSLTITGRLKLLIDIGGKKVNPLEVEAVLSSHPLVGSAVVVPIRLSESVQRLKAIITPARSDASIDIQGLRRFARERLSAYKVPRVFEIRAQLPLTAAGKIQRRTVEA